MSLTPRQKEILDFVRTYLEHHGYSPSLEEIGTHFGLSSSNAVFKHLRALEERGHIRRQPHASRSIELTTASAPPVTPGAEAPELPLLGTIAAGAPIEALEVPETMAVPSELLGRGTHFVLRVRGESMIDEHIADGDFVVVRQAIKAEEGDLVVALVDDANATLKRFHREDRMIRLQPANSAMAPLVVESDRVNIRGVVVGIIRKY